MNALVELSTLSMLLSLIAGLAMFAVRKWRSHAKWVFALAGISFLLSFGSTAGLSGIAALAILLSLAGFAIALLMLIMPRLRASAQKILIISLGALVAGVVTIASVQEPVPKPDRQEVASLKKSEPQQTPPPQQSKAPEHTVSALAPRPKESPPAKAIQPAFTPETMYVDATRLDVRNGPSKSHKVIWTLKDNEKVVVVGRENGWAQLRGDRYQGWVFATYLTPKPDTVKTAKQRQSETVTHNTKPNLSDTQIAKILIERSLAYYSGNCPCPYNRARNGSRCGGRSAYSRPGGASPLCYIKDVTKSMIANYRARN